MRQIMHLLPYENICYYGDTARVPYGSKSRDTIIRYSLENTAFLLEKNIKLLVVACNTASAHAIEALRQTVHVPVIGVIEPGAARAVEVTKKGCIAVIATRATIQSGAYQREICRYLPKAEVISQPCPLFVPLVEENMTNSAVVRLVIEEYLSPVVGNEIDTILLGCTHYPLLADAIKEYVGSEVALVDSASTCAFYVRDSLNIQGIKKTSNTRGVYQYYVSDDPERFSLMGTRFLGTTIEAVHDLALFQR